MVTSENSFRRGWLKVPKGKLDDVKREIMRIMEIKAYSAWFSRLAGKKILRQIDKEAIEKVFAQHGISDIWGRE
jgi:hypothetical protein